MYIKVLFIDYRPTIPKSNCTVTEIEMCLLIIYCLFIFIADGAGLVKDLWGGLAQTCLCKGQWPAARVNSQVLFVQYLLWDNQL